MNWFSITMYARARKKGMIPSARFASNVEPATTGDKKHVTRMQRKNERTIKLTINPPKEIA